LDLTGIRNDERIRTQFHAAELHRCKHVAEDGIKMQVRLIAHTLLDDLARVEEETIARKILIGGLLNTAGHMDTATMGRLCNIKDVAISGLVEMLDLVDNDVRMSEQVGSDNSYR
jgi:hypothetical protein